MKRGTAQCMNIAVMLFAAASLVACDQRTPPPAPSVAPAASAPAPAAPAARTAKPDPDASLAEKVRNALASAPGLNGHAFDVTARNGRVSVFGTAASPSHRSEAARLAAAVEGVTSVDNQIKIVSGS